MEDYLCHYGVLGMKWGKRKNRSSSSSSNKRTKEEKAKIRATKKIARYDSKINRQNKKIARYTRKQDKISEKQAKNNVKILRAQGDLVNAKAIKNKDKWWFDNDEATNQENKNRISYAKGGLQKAMSKSYEYAAQSQAWQNKIDKAKKKISRYENLKLKYAS